MYRPHAKGIYRRINFGTSESAIFRKIAEHRLVFCNTRELL